MLVVVCPGQGSQTPGFLEPWLAHPAYAEQLRVMSEQSRTDLVSAGTLGDADTIRDTAIAQPLIVAAGVLALGALFAVAPPSAALPATRSARSPRPREPECSRAPTPSPWWGNAAVP
jgi:hypothetical protein